MVRNLGVTFETREIDAASLQQLESEYAAIFLGVGLGAMHTLAVAGGTLPAVVDALEFIAGYKTGQRLEVGKRVVVIGGREHRHRRRLCRQTPRRGAGHDRVSPQPRKHLRLRL